MSLLGSTAWIDHLLANESRDQRTAIRLGLVTYNWGRDWDLPTVIANCEKTGFAGVELRSTHKHGVEPDLTASQRREVARRFADSPVELVGLGTACEYHAADPAVVQKNIEESQAFIRLCHDLGGGGIKVRPNRLLKDVPVEKTLEQIGQALRKVAAFGDGFGVAIRLEVHGHGTQELPHIKTIMDVADHPNLFVCWNCNPQDLKGDGFDTNFDLVADQIGTVHIHDLRSDAYPWAELVKKLKASHFTGWALLEEGKSPKDIVQAMHENRKIWQQLNAG
jgi:sugar phosphate isomerase/epimerase